MMVVILSPALGLILGLQRELAATSSFLYEGAEITAPSNPCLDDLPSPPFIRCPR